MLESDSSVVCDVRAKEAKHKFFRNQQWSANTRYWTAKETNDNSPRYNSQWDKSGTPIKYFC